MAKSANPLPAASELTVNQPGDAFERQADIVAGNPSPSPKRSGATPPPVTPDVAATIRQPHPGRPLSPDLRGRLEPRVGADLGQARVHEDSQAAAAAATLSARAFTAGNHIFLGAGESSSDARLMAHESAHVVQQQRGGTPAVQRVEVGEALATAWSYTGGAAIEAGAELASDVIEFTADTAWSIIEELAPQLAQLIRDIHAAGGIFDYLQNLLGGVIDNLFSGVGEDSGILAGFLATFDALLAASQEILEPLLAGDCEPLFAAVGRLQETISQMAGDAWNAIVEFFEPVGQFFSDLWADFGAPVVDWIGEVAGEIWQDIQDIASDIWEWTQPVRDAFASAWEWVKEQLGIGADTEDSEGGLLDWVQQKLGEAWDAILALLEPVIAPIRGVIDQVMAVLPLDAILNLRETIQGWLENAGSMVNTMQEPEGVAEQQTSLRDEILPAVLATAASVRESIVNAGSWVASVIGSVVEQVTGFVNALSQNSLTSHLTSLLQWVADGVASLGQWAQETVASLFGFLGDGLVYLAGFIEPILNLLQQLISVLGDLLGQLPDLITGGLWSAIPECILDPIKNFLIENILSHIPIFSQLLQIPDIWARISSLAMRILRQVFVDGNLFGAAWTFFSALLELMGIPPQLVTNILQNALNVFSSILQDPVGFLINLLRAVKEGFVKFFGNIGQHLLDGVMGWLFGQVQEAGLTPPTEFSLRGILGFVLQILDITTERIFQRMEQNPRIGPERVALLRRALAIAETAWGWITTLINEGPGGLWRQLQERLSDLWQTVLTSVIGWITNTIITTASARLLSLLDPTGIMAVVNSLIAIYRAIESFMQYLRQMLEIVNTVLGGIAGIARGAIEQAASFLESALARALPIAIGFLANQVGLGGISRRLREMVEDVRQLVDRAIDWLIERALNLGQAILNALGLGGEAAETPPAAAGGEFIYERPVGAHTVKIRRDLTVVQFSDPVVLTGTTAQQHEQMALESIVPRIAPTYPADGLERATGPSGHVTNVKEGEERESLPAVRNLPGGVPAYQPGDHRGHLIGDRFFGQGVAGNLVPMHPTLNLSTFKTYENTLATRYRALFDDEKAVLLFMQITPHYPHDDAANPASYRPTTVTASSKIITLQPGAATLTKQEQTFPGTFTNPSAAPSEVNLNTASREDLLAIRLSARLVDAVLAERELGRFRDVDMMMLRLTHRLGDHLVLLEELNARASVLSI